MTTQDDDSRRWLLSLARTEEPEFRLFCLPYAGGGAAFFLSWSKLVPQQVQVIGLQRPGRENRMEEAPLRRMEPLVTAMADAMTPVLDKPFALLGYSAGAIMAYELALELRRRGLREPSLFTAVACRPPHALLRETPCDQMTDEELIAKLDRNFEGVPLDVLNNRHLRRLFLPPLRADLEVTDYYEGPNEGRLSCPLLMLGGDRDKAAPKDRALEWQRFSEGPFQAHFHPGGHFFLREEPKHLEHALAPWWPKLFSGP